MQDRRLVGGALVGAGLLLGVLLWLLFGSEARDEDAARRVETASPAAAALPDAAEAPALPLGESALDAASALVAPASDAAPAAVAGELQLVFTGRVVDVSGRGVSAARVELVAAPDNANLSGMPLGKTPTALASATSDAQGRYRLPIAEGQITAPSDTYVRALADGFAPAARIVMPRGVGESGLADIVLQAAGGVAGRITDAWGASMGGALVAQAPPTATLTGGLQRLLLDAAPAIADEDGRFELRHVAAGSVDLLVIAPGHPAWRTGTGHVLAAGGRVDVGTLALPEGESFSGRLLDANGPVAGGRIAVKGVGTTVEVAAISDAEGRFRFGGLTRRSVKLRSTAPGHLPGESSFELPLVAPVEIVLERTRSLVVRARGAEGQPVQRGRVSLRKSTTELSGADFRDGEATVELAGEGALLVTAEGCAAMVVEDPADLEGDLELQLQPESVIRGRAHLFQPDTPLAGLRVRTTKGPLAKHGFEASALTDAEGRFVLGGLTAGEWPLSADRPGLRPGRFGTTLAAGETKELDLAFTSGGRLEGTVTTSRGAPVPGVLVRVNPQRPQATTDDAGRFVIEGLATGDVFATVADTPGKTTVHIEEGQTTTVALVVPTRGVIAGRVHTGTHNLSDAKVLLRAPGSQDVQVATDARGEFRVEGLQPATWALEARLADGLCRAHRNIELADGAEQFLDLDVAGGALRVVVRQAEDSAPLPGAIVRAENGTNSSSGELTTDADGVVRIADLPPGEVRLLVRAERRFEVEHKVQLKPGAAETPIEVALEGAARIEVQLLAADGGDTPVLVALQRTDGNTRGVAAGGWVLFGGPMKPVAGTGDRTANGNSGRVVFDHVPPGAVELVVRQLSAGRASRVGVPGLSSVSVTLSEGKSAPLAPGDRPELARLALQLRAGDVAQPQITVQPVREK